MDYKERLSDDSAIRWTDRLTVDGTWNANLFQFYMRVIQRLSADLKLPFQLEHDLFRKGETEVHEAIRETFVNALIHADYQGVGGIIVEKYKDHFDFSNPGTLLITLEQLLRGNVSECRNKALQTMFMMIGAAEKVGSGVDKIRKGWASQHWRSPFVREQNRPDRVYWQLPMISLIPQESLSRLEKCFGDKLRSFSQLEVQGLVTADLEGFVDNVRMRQITGTHATDITRILQSLVAKGALVREGQARWSRYRLPVEQDSLHNSIHSLHKGIHSIHKEIDSIHKEVDSIHKAGDEERASLHCIADPARNNLRLPPAEMERIIRELCSNRWLSTRELSELLNRNADGLRARFLGPMVGHGLLQLRYPDKPNRVDQAYTASSDIS